MDVSLTEKHQNQKYMGQPDNWFEKADAEQWFGRLFRPIDPHTWSVIFSVISPM